jgi:RIP metalloprotease RseP
MTPQPAVDEPSGPSFGDRIAASKGLRMAVLLGALGYLAVFKFWYFVIIMALVVSIFLHEMGHYLVAKRNGMKVTEFFLGFGPRIWSFQRGETEYGIKLIWVGAYVKIIGMSNLDEIAPADEPRTYRAQPFGKRMPVVLAGPAMNLLLGFLILFVVIAGFGKPSATEWNVDSVTVGSAAEEAGLQTGDRIVAFDGQETTDFDSLTSLVRAHAGTTVDLTVERDGQEIIVPANLGWSLTAESAGQLGLRASDRVTEVNGAPVNTYADLVGAMQNAEGPTTLTYVRARTTATHEVTGPIELPGDAYKGFLGVGPGTVYERVSVAESATGAASEFGTVVVRSVQGIGHVFSPAGIGSLANQVATATDDKTETAGQSSSGSSDSGSSGSSSVAADRPSSIIGIVDIGAQLGGEAGWGAVLYLLAMVNIFLGLINLAPLLPLDGGHIVVACYEEIRTRISHKPYRVNMAKLLPVTYVVLLLMVGLFLSTAYLDVVDRVQISP